ncbi:hypothetical protein R4227_14515 [Gordonia amicalis]|nr:hypothetical protein [Gordonia amicalis]MDV7101302.1 hypothetical protein [Gordonia amicalis]
MVEQFGTHSVVLVIVCDNHRNLTTLGPVRLAITLWCRAHRHQVRDPDQPHPGERTEREMPAILCADVRRQDSEITRAQREEPKVGLAITHLLVQRDNRRLVGRLQWADEQVGGGTRGGEARTGLFGCIPRVVRHTSMEIWRLEPS